MMRSLVCLIFEVILTSLKKKKKIIARSPLHLCHLQVRKYRTMTEIIIDAIEFVKNPYKGKKLKVSLTLFFGGAGTNHPLNNRFICQSDNFPPQNW